MRLFERRIPPSLNTNQHESGGPDKKKDWNNTGQVDDMSVIDNFINGGPQILGSERPVETGWDAGVVSRALDAAEVVPESGQSDENKHSNEPKGGSTVADPHEMVEALRRIEEYRDALKSEPSLATTVVKDTDMNQVLDELYEHITAAIEGRMPVLTNRLGYFCGKSAAHHNVIFYNPVEYVDFVHNLFATGKARFGGSGLKIKVPKELRDQGTSNRQADDVSEVFGESLNASTTKRSGARQIINLFSKKLKEPRSYGNTIPHEYNRIMGALDMPVIDKRYEVIPQKVSGKFKVEDIKQMVKAIDMGYIPIVFEDHMLSHGSTNSEMELYGIHFIPITKMALDEAKGEVIFTFWEYGGYNDRIMSIAEFCEGVKGYWIPKEKGDRTNRIK